MKNYIVIDLEMCHVTRAQRKNGYDYGTESIQLGAVKMNEDMEIVDEFTSFIAPEYGVLTEDISRLTRISKHDLKEAPDFQTVMMKFCSWLPDQPIFVTWSDTDQKQLLREYQEKNMQMPDILNSEWIDCQKMFDEKMENERCYGLENALNLSNIDYRDGLHNGLVDAYNTALLFAKLKRTPDYPLNNHLITAGSEQESDHLHVPLGNLLAGLELNSAAS